MRKMLYKDFQQIKNDGTYFVAFTTPWCSDCAIMKIVFNNLELEVKKNNKNIQFIEIDADESKLLRTDSEDFKVMRIPAMSFVHNGKVKFIGYERMPIREIIKAMELNKLK